MKPIVCFVVLIGCLQSCKEKASSQNHQSSNRVYESKEFKQYWYAGKAEVNAYNLDQSRYGENRKGKAILIFVAEDFSKKKQVKLDDVAAAGEDKVGVLKMNFTKNFLTGIYPYSMMLSTFTPISRNQYPNSMKFTMSSQEWCGQVFTQMNLNKDSYGVDSYSYFEKEGDEHFSVKSTLAEDELMNIIRLNPGELEIGDITLLPGLFFTRLKHQNLQPLRAKASKNETDNEISYAIKFIENERELVIRFTKEFPHTITSWQETFTERGQKVKTSAVLDKTLSIDYWTKNKNEFNYLRDSLNLSTDY